jgi:hypothetical protein
MKEIYIVHWCETGTGADFYGVYSSAENADRALFEIIDKEWKSDFGVRPQDVGDAQQAFNRALVDEGKGRLLLYLVANLDRPYSD